MHLCYARPLALDVDRGEKKKKSKGKLPPTSEEPTAVQPERPVPLIAESKPPAASEKGAKKKSSKSSSGPATTAPEGDSATLLI
jgi:hypothetical protein